MKKIVSIALVLVMIVGMMVLTANAETTDYSGKTVILYTGNVRGDVSIYAKIAAARAAYEAAGATVYLVDAGNYLQGSAYANSDRGLSIYNLMDAAGYDVAAMGKYEFVYGEATTGYIYHANLTRYYTQAELLGGAEELEYRKNAPWAPTPVMDTRPAKAAAAFDVVCSNLTIGSDATGYYDFAANTVLGESLKVGFVAVAEENLADSLQDGFLTGYTYGTVTAPECDVLVCLGDGEGDIVIQAPADGEPVYGAYVIDNATKQVTTEEVDLTGSDAAVAAMVEAIVTSNVVGTADVTLNGADGVNWNGESNLGDLTADALKWYAENRFEGFHKSDVAAVVAIQNGGNCDNFLYTGDITEVDLLRALPFSPMGVGILYMTGAQLLETLEASTQQENCPGWAQVSGIEYEVHTYLEYDAGEAYGDFYKCAEVKRVVITSVGGQDFDPNATYAVIADNFLMNGNDTYYTFKEIKSAEGATYLNNGNGVKTRDIVAMYIKEVLGGKVGSRYAAPQGRITVVSENPGNPDSGNSTAIALPAALLTVSLLGMAVVIGKRKEIL